MSTKGVEQAVASAVAHGVDRLLVVEGEEYRVYTTDAYVSAMSALVEKYAPTTLLIGATLNGRDMASGSLAACTPA